MSIDQILHGFAEARNRSALATIGGIKHEGALTFEQIRDELLPWTAIEGELTTTVLTPDGVHVAPAPKHKAILRDDTYEVIGVVGKTFAIHQPREWVADNLELLLSSGHGELAVQSAGTANGGGQVWIQVANPENRVGPGGFEFRPFILAATGLDGSLSTIYKKNSIAIICENTYRASLKRSENMEVRLRHTSGSAFRLGEVRDTLQVVFETGDQFERELEELLAIEVADRQFEQIVAGLTAGTTDSQRSKSISERKAGELMNLWRNDTRVAPWRGTALGAMQALSTWQQHVATVKNVDRTMRNAVNVVNGTTDRNDLTNIERVLAAVGA